MPFDPARAKTLFLAASDLPPADRPAFLDRECPDDSDLRARIENLLAADVTSASPPVPADPTTAPPVDAHGLVLAGKYKLVELIGEGGMGSVWLAHQTEPVKRKVAVKLIKLGMDSRQVLSRFEAERQALAMMDHPNIATVLDGGLAPDGRPFFVMELVKGVPITDYCDAARLGVRERLDLFVPVCQAIQHAHQKGIIHRDIKPANVLIALYDDRPVPKIIDFGVAKATGGDLTEHTVATRFGGVIGTPAYMSPEQATLNNIDIDTRSDVYSLGVLLYELLTGSPPFSKDDLQQRGLMEVLRVIREDEPPKPSTKLSSAATLPALSASRNTEPRKLTALLRSELDWIVLKALEKNRARRYETANGFAADVQRYLAGEPVAAHPPSSTYRLRKFARKHRPAVVSAALLAAVLLSGIVATTWQARRAAQQRDFALAAREGEARQRRTAEAERDKAALIADFMSDTLQGAGPSQARGRDITMLREMMDAASARINRGDLRTAPGAELRLRDTLGVTYFQLGLFPETARMFEPAVPLAKSVHKGDHLDVAHALEDLGELRQAQGDFAAAEPLLTEALAMYQRLFPQGDPWVAVALNNLAANHQYRGNYTEAERLLRESLAVRLRLTPGDSEPVAINLSNLATILTMRSDFKGAERFARDALAMSRRLHPGDTPATAGSLGTLADLLVSAGDLAGAEPNYRESLAMYQRLFKSDHPTIVTGLDRLAAIRRSLGDLDEAERLYRQSLDMAARVYPAGHAHVANALGSLGMLLQDRNDLAAAEPLFRDALAMSRRLGEDAAVATAANNLAFLLQARRQFPQAETLYLETLDIYKRLFPQGHPAIARTLGNLGHLRQSQGDLPGAEPFYRDALAMYRRILPHDHPDVARALNNLASVVPPAEAEPLAREGLAISERTLGPHHWSTANVRVKLGIALTGLGRYDEAESQLLDAQRVISTTEGGPPTLQAHVARALDDLHAARSTATPLDPVTRPSSRPATTPTAP